MVEDLDLTLASGEILGLVGESGAGKTMTALGIMRLIPPGFGHVAGGSVLFEGRDLLALPFSEMRRVRGAEIAMIFQDPMSRLNPVYSIGDQIAEAVMLHERAPRVVARRRALEMLDRVGIPEARRRMDDYPHQFSGGMRQRAMLAMALCCQPPVPQRPWSDPGPPEGQHPQQDRLLPHQPPGADPCRDYAPGPPGCVQCIQSSPSRTICSVAASV